MKAITKVAEARRFLTSIAQSIEQCPGGIEEACRLLEIPVLSQDLRGQGGMAIEVATGRSVVVDASFRGPNRAFVVAHELCHLLLAPALLVGLPVAAEEGLCDYFASGLSGITRVALSA